MLGFRLLAAVCFSSIVACGLARQVPEAHVIGQFDSHSDVGSIEYPGSVDYDPADKTYTVVGGGENIWFTTDAFHFVWRKVVGDVSLAAAVRFLGVGRNPHRKACVMIRQSLDPDSAYADVAVHGDGLTSLQYRDTKGGTTHEIQSNMTDPKRVGIEKRGDTFFFSVAGAGEYLRPAGGSARVPMQGDYYIGLAVSSHEKDLVETAMFSDVEMLALKPVSSENQRLYSALETVAVASTDRRVVRVEDQHFEAPNWTPDGLSIIYNGGGRLYRVPVTGGEPQLIDTGFAVRCNNDHGISPDGSTLVVSDQSQGDHQSVIYTVPATGGAPKRITAGSPSYWHGWSPDGKTLAFCGQRDGSFGIFTVPAAGGEEKRLTTAVHLDDGPDYSPDGKYIYFNSDRTGLMQIWRMLADGSALEQITSDDANNWFPHISPDGKKMVFLTYDKDVSGHPPNKDVMLRLMNLSDQKVTVLAKLFGGQGTINVPSWSPDSKRLAFVSYQLLP